MWSIALIVGVAAIASIVLLAVGVSLAVWIERQRYSRYLQQHNAGTNPGDKNEIAQSLCESVDNSEQRTSLQASALPPSSDTWATLPSTETIDHDMNSVCITTDAVLAEGPQETPSRTSEDLVKKKKQRHRRRLKRTAPLREVLSSPLPAITESDSPIVSPLQPPLSVLDAESTQNSDDVMRLSQQVPQERKTSMLDAITPATDSLVETNKTAQNTDELCSRLVPRLVGTTISASLAPGEPLPPLPVADCTKPVGSVRERCNSVGSMESISSSVLVGMFPSPVRDRDPVQKSQSQAWKEFDFGLNTITKVKSRHQEPDNLVNGFEHNSGCSRLATESFMAQSDEREKMHPWVDRSEATPADQYSTTRIRSRLHRFSTHAETASHNRLGDPFIVDDPQRLAFNGEQILLQRGLRDYPHGSTPGCSCNILPRSDTVDTDHDAASRQQRMPSASIAHAQIGQSTNEQYTDQNWQFDMVPPDTPTLLKSSSSPKSHQSLILRSPAYPATGLRLNARKHRLGGPRSAQGLRSRSQSPLKSETKFHNTGLGLNFGAVAEEPKELHRDDSSIGSPSRQPSLLRPDIRVHDTDKIGKAHVVRVVSGSPKQVDLGSSQSLCSASPSDAQRYSRLATLTTKSSESVAESSIWEDASILEESPEPDVPVLTPTKLGHTLMAAASSPAGTPPTKIEDYEAFMNAIRGYGGGTPSSQCSVLQLSSMERRHKAPVELGTPGSMYDASGFLKV